MQLSKKFFAAAALILFAEIGYSQIPIQMGLSPDNSLDLLMSTLKSARSELLVNIYQFDRKDITDLLVSKIQDGLTLRILIEGEPVGKVSNGGQKTISALTAAIRNNPSSKSHLYI